MIHDEKKNNNKGNHQIAYFTNLVLIFFFQEKKLIWEVISISTMFFRNLHDHSKTDNIQPTLYNGHLELVPAFFYSLYLTLYKTDTTEKGTSKVGPCLSSLHYLNLYKTDTWKANI